MGKRLTIDSFLERSYSVHGFEYDYSKVLYKNSNTEVCIICRIHGPFFQQPRAHMAGQGCPECAKIKRKKTCLDRYGIELPILREENREKTKNTLQRMYGVNNVFQLESVKEKSRNTVHAKYGVDNIAYLRRKADYEERLQHAALSPDERKIISDEKRRQTCIRLYGVPYAIQADSVKSKIQNTIRNRYHVNNGMQDVNIRNRAWDTAIKNQSFRRSRQEDFCYKQLCEVFGENDVIRQYMSNSYPFRCDFYIASRDMYIESNLFWTHGGHWYDAENEVDRNRLQEWLERAEFNSFYKSAARIWSEIDVQKRIMARQNGLNYAVFWNNDLSDFMEWIHKKCIDRHDY